MKLGVPHFSACNMEIIAIFMQGMFSSKIHLVIHFLIHFHLCSTEAVSLQCVRSDCAVRHMKGSSCCVSVSPPAAVNKKAFCSWCGLDKSVRMILTFREQTVPISCFSHDAFCIPCETELCSTQWNV